MIRLMSAAAPLVVAGCMTTVMPGEMEGEAILSPEGCQDTLDRLCQLGAEIRFRPAETPGVEWASAVYAGAAPDGTTDGASIPRFFWDIIGGPYTPEFLRPAILHDHYTYPVNRVRPWRATHRLFYYALLHEGVDPTKALWMYYAVYVFGAHWAELVPGDDCGEGCIQSFADDARIVTEPDRIESAGAQADLEEVWTLLNGPTVLFDERDPLASVEALAEARHPGNLFLRNDETIEVTDEVLDWLARRGVDGLPDR